MNKLVLLISSIFLLSFCYSQDDAFVVKPILVISESNTSFYSKDATVFALYNNREIIYRKLDSENSMDYKKVIVDSTEYADLLALLKDAKFFNYEAEYDLGAMGSASHQTSVSLYSFLGRYPVKITVEEDIGNKLVGAYYRKRLAPDSGVDEAYEPLSKYLLPGKLYEVFERLISFEHTKEEVYVPEKIEISLFPGRGKCEQKWPSKWAIDELTISGTPSAGFLTIKPPNREFMNDLIEEASHKCVVRIGKRKYLTDFQLVLPFEEYWKD